MPVKVRTNGTVINRPAYVVVGVDVDGRKHVLGVWLGDGGEGAKYWLSVLTEIRNRGLEDALIVAVTASTGRDRGHMAPGAGTNLCHPPAAASMRLCSWKNRKAVVAGLRRVYTAVNAETAAEALDELEEQWGNRYESVGRVHPVSTVPARAVYTTNVVESVHYQLRKVTKTRGHFPTDQSALKLLRLAARNITNKRGGNLGTGRLENSPKPTRNPLPQPTKPNPLKTHEPMRVICGGCGSAGGDGSEPLRTSKQVGCWCECLPTGCPLGVVA